LFVCESKTEYGKVIACTNLGYLPRTHASEGRKLDVPGPFTSLRKPCRFQQACADDARGLRWRRSARKIGREFEVTRDLQIEFDVRIALLHAGSFPGKVERLRLIEARPAVMRKRDTRQGHER
jgi:hypothetical protein